MGGWEGLGATVAAVTMATAPRGWLSDVKEIQPWDIGLGARIPFLGLPAQHVTGHQETETWARQVSGVTGEPEGPTEKERKCIR